MKKYVSSYISYLDYWIGYLPSKFYGLFFKCILLQSVTLIILQAQIPLCCLFMQIELN